MSTPEDGPRPGTQQPVDETPAEPPARAGRPAEPQPHDERHPTTLQPDDEQPAAPSRHVPPPVDEPPLFAPPSWGAARPVAQAPAAHVPPVQVPHAQPGQAGVPQPAVPHGPAPHGPAPHGPAPHVLHHAAPTHAAAVHHLSGSGHPVSATGAVLTDPTLPADPGGVPGTRRTTARRSSGGGRTLPLVWVVTLVLLALVAGLVGGLVGGRLVPDDERLADAGLPVSVPRATGAGEDGTPTAGTVSAIAAAVLPSVVSIESDGAEGVTTGSGFVLRQDGYLLTNSHVVAGADRAGGELTVTFADGTELPATIVGRTPEYDLAVLKVDAQDLVPLALGDSGAVAVGDPVVAVGAPLGLAGTVTTGIVSALNRPVTAGDETDTAFINAIQTDAAINPGNSGGPLVDARGEVIGINSAIAQPPGTSATSGGSIGLGFAIPSDQARRTATQLIETGHATYPIIGVLLDDQYAGEGVKVAAAEDRAAVTPDGPADAAGIREGDVILSIDGRPVTEPDELIVAIRAHEPGDVVTLTVRTGDDEREVRVELDEAE